MSYTDELELFNVLSSQLSNQLSKKYLSKKHNDKDVVIDSTFDAGAYISSILDVLNGVNKPEESNEEDLKFNENDCKCDDTCCDDACCDDICNKEEEKQFKGLSTEVKHKNKTIPVKNAELEPYCCDAEDEGNPFTFSATLGENSNIRLFTRPVDEYDEDLSHVGNAKKFVSGYLKDNPEVVTILEKIDDKDVHSYSAEATKAEEAVDIITTVKKHSWVSAVVSFPVGETFEVVSQLTSKNPEIRFEIYPAGKKNILVAV